jgi:hypothetical protein
LCNFICENNQAVTINQKNCGSFAGFKEKFTWYQSRAVEEAVSQVDR